ncbi:hypothetical protein NLI96_g3307 [Meripilus lineatus]|uniref:BTB domain-containing protein n=1 Tax=Meripilus lineatus TaxID=2056292 RepID=A0AAD5YFR8_9APHY|nr:hypothetical protein NLI96_g3307 [Physisporinus lineatus]
MNICRGLLTSTDPAPPVPVGLIDYPEIEPSLIPYTPHPNTLSSEEFHTTVTEAADNAAFSGGPFLDIQIFAFSRKRPGEGADKPRAVYANSTVLRASCPYFADLLGEHLSGSNQAPLSFLDSEFFCGQGYFNSQYDYTGDSDLEDVDDGVLDASEIQTNNEREVFGPMELLGGQPEELLLTQGRPVGRTFLLPNIAYATLRAFIFYLYTQRVSYRPLRSQDIPSASKSSTPVPDTSYLSSCSPKSMYRLARQFRIEHLETQALADLKTKISAGNAFEEIFSSLSLEYAFLTLINCGLHDNVLSAPDI